MAQFTIEIADGDVERVLTSLAANYRRPLQVKNPDNDSEMIDNPETIYQFGNRVVRSFLSENVEAYEIKLAKDQAASLVDTNVTINDPSI
tara:strand:- start:1342 stop:1611 length:270 start_codon:yes stop_codon:yes gene_type:complete